MHRSIEFPRVNNFSKFFPKIIWQVIYIHSMISKPITFNENENLLFSFFKILKSSEIARGVIPGLHSDPYIVNVFPDPVCP